jgi:hypothetical protein
VWDRKPRFRGKAGLALVAAVLAVPAPAYAADPVASPLKCDYWFSFWDDELNAFIRIINYGTTTINGWTAHWTFDQPMTDMEWWTAPMHQPSPYEMVAVNPPGQPLIYSRSLTTFGWSAKPRSTEVPDDITVNGLPCPIRQVIGPR